MTLGAFQAYAGSRTPKILLVGEAFGESEDELQQPFVGASGRLLWEVLGEVWFDVEPGLHRELFGYGVWPRGRDEWLELAGIGITNTLAFRPEGNRIESVSVEKKELDKNYPKNVPPIQTSPKYLYLQEQYLVELDRLRVEIDQARPNIIMGLGNVACWALQSTTGITGIRGSTARTRGHSGLVGLDRKFIASFHPAGVIRNWAWRVVLSADLIKAKHESGFAELIRPERKVLIMPGLGEIVSWGTRVLSNPPKYLACDIETAKGMTTCVGFAAGRDNAMVVRFASADGTRSHWGSASDEEVAWGMVATLLSSPIPKLFQNGMYDVQYLMNKPPRGMGLRVNNLLHDSMLLHHSILPEMKKDLGFLASIYSNESSWKLMRRRRMENEKADE